MAEDVPQVSGYHCIRTIARKWAVHRAGARRSIKTGMCRRDAWTMAKREAKRKGEVAYLHDHTGRIASRRDFTPG